MVRVQDEALCVCGSALIVGASGQDGSCLATLLLEKGCGVHGTSRDPFNHEPPFRIERFVTGEAVHATRRIAAGSRERLRAEPARPSDIAVSARNPAKVCAELGSKASYDLDMIVRGMVRPEDAV